MARAWTDYRWYRRDSRFSRHPGLLARKHLQQVDKRRKQAELFAMLTWAAPRPLRRSLYAKDRRFSGPSLFDAFQYMAKILSPVAGRHA